MRPVGVARSAQIWAMRAKLGQVGSYLSRCAMLAGVLRQSEDRNSVVVVMSSDQELWQWFSAIDADRSGQLDPEELQKALAQGNLHFSLIACSRIIRIHDKDNSGTISFNEFKGMHQFLTQAQQDFSQADASRQGRIDKVAVRRMLEQRGHQLDAPAFDALFSAYNPERSGTLDLTEAIALILFMQGAASTFAAFDSGRRGRIDLDFNQFVYAAANVV